MIHSLVIGLTLAVTDGSDFSMCILRFSLYLKVDHFSLDQRH